MIEKANDRLKIMAVKDQLTGIYNRQGLNEIFKGKFDQIAVIYADLDNFKYYNDTFGHEVGDLVLVQFAKLLGTATAEKADTVRYGGDEFLLIMYTEDKTLIEEAVRNIYHKLENFTELEEEISRKLGYSVEIPEEKKLSCSIGIEHTTKHTYTFFS